LDGASDILARAKITLKFPDGTIKVKEKTIPIKVVNFRAIGYYKGEWIELQPNEDGQPCGTVNAPLSENLHLDVSLR
jgi:hypothetical protein